MNLIKKVYLILDFGVFYLFKLFQANIYLAADLLSPEMKSIPAMIHVPVIIHSNFGLFLFSNLLSMTPGTLSMDISHDRKNMLVHILYRNDEEKVHRDIQKIQYKIKNITH